MASSLALLEAVTALNTKIKNAAPTATAEELAYLGSAIEKIAGHVTLVDLIDHVDTLKAALDLYRQDTQNNLNQTLTTAIENAMTDLARVKNEHIAEIDTKQMNAKADITQHVNTANASMQDTSAIVLTQVATAISNLTNAIDQANTAAEAIKDVQPITEAELYFFNS